MNNFYKYLFLFFFVASAAAKPIEILMWHSLSGQLGKEINQLVDQFNRSQDAYAVKPVYKGEYNEVLTSFAAAFRAKRAPAIVQIFEVGTATMLYPRGIIKPVDELMNEQGINLPKERFLPAVLAYYSEGNQLQAFPFNISIPLIYYNAEVLEQLGYKEGTFPHTWDEMEFLAKQLRHKGFSCAYTSAYPGWIQIESFAAIHGLSIFVPQKIDDKNSLYPGRVQTNYSEAILHHLHRLKRWQAQHYFEYGGRDSNTTALFTSGRCPLFSQSSGSYSSILKLVNFRLGVAPLPLDTGLSVKRHNNVVGGGGLWAVSGQSQDVYRGIALFFSYFAQPQIQQQWYLGTGYLPLEMIAVHPPVAKNKISPILALAEIDLSRDTRQTIPTNSPQNHIRMINDEVLETIFAQIKPPDQALNEAGKLVNYAYRRFLQNTTPRSC